MEKINIEYLDEVYENFDVNLVEYKDVWNKLKFLNRLIATQPKDEYDIACNLCIISEIVFNMMSCRLYQDLDSEKWKFILELCVKVSNYLNKVFKYTSREVSDWVTRNIFIRPLENIENRIIRCEYTNIYFDILQTLIILCACGTVEYPENEYFIKIDKFIQYSFLQKKKHSSSEIIEIVNKLEYLYSNTNISGIINRYSIDFRTLTLEYKLNINWCLFQSEFDDLNKRGLVRSDSDKDFLS